MHIRKASPETYLALKSSLKAPLTYVANETEIETLSTLFHSFIEADQAFSDQCGVHYRPDKYVNDMLPFQTALNKMSECGLKDKNPRIAGITHVYLQALKPSSISDRYPPYFMDMIVEQEDAIEEFLKDDPSDEAFEVRKILSQQKFHANRAMTREWQSGSMSKLADHLVKTQGLGL